MSELNRSVSHFSGLSLPPACPSLSLICPLMKSIWWAICSHLRRKSDLNTRLPVNHGVFIFMGSMVPIYSLKFEINPNTEERAVWCIKSIWWKCHSLTDRGGGAALMASFEQN